MEKNKLLKVSSILLIVFGVFIALISIFFFAAGELIAGIIGSSSDVAADMMELVVIVLGIVMLVEAIAYIAAGVIGVQQKSAKLCFIVGIILVVVCGIGAITNILEGQILSAIIALIVPVLYLVGAIQLKKAAADEAMASANEQNI